MPFPDRRRFMTQLLGGAAAAFAAPDLLGALTPDQLLSRANPPAGGGCFGPGPGSAADEAYWERVRDQFPLAPGLVLMNAANLCPSPYPVQDAVFRHTRDVDRDASFQNRAKFSELKEEAREALAGYVGASPEEIAITRNTSEGNNTVVNGLDLGPGDEVILWDQNHPTNNISWDVRARRTGFTVRRISTPWGENADPGSLLEPFLEAFSPSTRVLAFSHVSNVSGTALPAAELCRAGRERGILTLVDGAQTFGAVQLDLHAMGCDFFSASSHKWFVGPKEAGILYVREASQDLLWPSDVGVGWEGAREAGARKFENMGQRDDAAVVSMAIAAAFHRAVGPEAVEIRVRELADAVRWGLDERIPGIRIFTPSAEASRAGVVVFEIPGRDHDALFEALYRDDGIGCAAMHGLFSGLRLSPHIYNTMDQVQYVLEAVVAHV